MLFRELYASGNFVKDNSIIPLVRRVVPSYSLDERVGELRWNRDETANVGITLIRYVQSNRCVYNFKIVYVWFTEINA